MLYFKLGFQNSLNEVSVVQLKVSCPGAPGSKTDTVAEGQPYKLRAEVLKYDGQYFRGNINYIQNQLYLFSTLKYVKHILDFLYILQQTMTSEFNVALPLTKLIHGGGWLMREDAKMTN